MDVQQIAPGLWRWTARHPDWTPEEGGPDGWEPDVASVYLEGDDAVVMIDPQVPGEPGERHRFLEALDRDLRRAGKPLAVLITVRWHGRSADYLRERYPDVTVWARDDVVDAVATHRFAPGDALPAGVEAIDAGRAHEVVFWIPRHRTLVAGDALLGAAGGGLRPIPDSWVDDAAVEKVRAALLALLDLPVDTVVVTHGEPVLGEGADALRRALA